MGPRLVSRGNAKTPVAAGAAGVMLQWGRGLLAAEMTYKGIDVIQEGWLQWGRGLLAAEIP